MDDRVTWSDDRNLLPPLSSEYMTTVERMKELGGGVQAYKLHLPAFLWRMPATTIDKGTQSSSSS